MRGKVRSLFKDKNYGFILGEDGKDYFLHRTECPEFENIQIGDEVEFEEYETEKGLRAGRISRV